MDAPILHLVMAPARAPWVQCVVCGRPECDAEIPLPDVHGYARTAVFGLPLDCAAHLGKVTDVDGRTRDLGGGGLKAELAGELPEGTAATLTLWTRWGSVTLQGTVVWRRSAKRGILHGFMFDDPIGDARARELHQEATGPP